MRRSSCLLAGLIVFLPAIESAEAQVVVGRVMDADHGGPLDVAFVVLLDDRGERRASVLTNARGAFRLRAPAPGRYRVRVERIGYRDVESAFLDIPEDGSVRLSLTASAQAIALAGLEIEGDPRCSVRPAEGEVAARLWDEARKALAVATWAQNAQVLRFRIVQWERKLDPATLRVVEERRTPRTSFHGGSPFSSRPAGELQERGYIQEEEDGGRIYYAPDPPVLLSDHFLDAHCLRARLRDPPENGWVGLAFEPVQRGSVPDIEGVLWLDKASGALERLEYRYTRLPENLQTDLVGGTVDFDQIPEGPWIVRRWTIRTPVVGVRERHVLGQLRIRREPYLAGIGETGGQVVAIRTPDGSPLLQELGSEPESQPEPWAEPQPEQPAQRAALRPAASLTTDSTPGYVDTHVSVRDVETDKVVPEVSVRLDDGPWRSTDTHGRVDLGPVPAGPHRLELRHIAFGVWADTLVVQEPGPHHWMIELTPSAIGLEGVTVAVDAAPAAERSRKTWIRGATTWASAPAWFAHALQPAWLA